ncbi:unnamed protein product [Closterium sp. NIES-64]|nr:unnamed protein product [Closterium sp. NIES-64]
MLSWWSVPARANPPARDPAPPPNAPAAAPAEGAEKSDPSPIQQLQTPLPHLRPASRLSAGPSQALPLPPPSLSLPPLSLPLLPSPPLSPPPLSPTPQPVPPLMKVVTLVASACHWSLSPIPTPGATLPSEAQQAEQQQQQEQQEEQEQNELQRWAAAVGWGEMMGAYSVLHTDDNTDLHLFSLHVTRGLAILGLLLCAYLGPSFPAFAPSPWHGFSLADLPLPLLLYTVGLSLALAYTQVPSVLAASNKVYIRFCKIFYLGYFLQGGFLHPIGDTTFGVSLENTRFCGMLQVMSVHGCMGPCPNHISSSRNSLTAFHVSMQLRMPISSLHFLTCHLFACLRTRVQQVAAALLVVGVSEVAVMKLYRGARRPPGVHHHALGFLINWCVALLLVLLYASLSYLLFVPSYTVSTTTSIHSNTTTVTTAIATTTPSSHLAALHQDGPWEGAGGQRRALQGGTEDGGGSLAVHCGVRGSFAPDCTAAGYIDRVLMGPTHMLSTAPFHSLPECQSTSPPPPAWCQAPFDPQGILSTVGACLVAFAGLHHGHLLTYFNTHSWRIFRSLLFAAVLLATGVTLSMPMPLRHSSLPSFLPESILSAWLGRNPLFVLVLGVCRLLDLLLAGFYVNNDPASNLVRA